MFNTPNTENGNLNKFIELISFINLFLKQGNSKQLQDIFNKWEIPEKRMQRLREIFKEFDNALGDNAKFFKELMRSNKPSKETEIINFVNLPENSLVKKWIETNITEFKKANGSWHKHLLKIPEIFIPHAKKQIALQITNEEFQKTIKNKPNLKSLVEILLQELNENNNNPSFKNIIDLLGMLATALGKRNPYYSSLKEYAEELKKIDPYFSSNIRPKP